MLFGAYVQNNLNQRVSSDELESILGFDPIFCFPITDAKNTILSALLAENSGYDRFVVFKTDDYMVYNTILFNKMLAECSINGDSDITIDDCKSILVKKSAKTYIVDDIDEDDIMFQTDIMSTYFMDVDCESTDDDMKAAVSNVVKSLQKRAYAYCSTYDVYPSYKLGKTMKDFDDEQKEIILRGFSMFLLPLCYATVFQIDLCNMVDFNIYRYFDNVDPKIKSYVDSIADANLSELSEMYSKITEDLYKCCDRTINDNIIINEVRANNIGPNDLCPCGSGLKFKKCCKRRLEL